MSQQPGTQDQVTPGQAAAGQAASGQAGGRRIDVVVAAASLALVAFFLITLFVLIPRYVPSPPGQALRPISPAFFPILVSILGAVASAAAFLESVIIGVRDDDDREVFVDFPILMAALRLGAVLAAAFGFFLILRPLGALPASVLVMVVLMLLGGVRNPLTLASVSVLLPLAIYLIFVRVALVPFPRGIMPF